MKTAVDFLHSEYNRILGSVLVTPQQIIEMSDALENAKEIEKGQMGYSEEDVIKIVEKSRETGLTAEYLLVTFKQQEQ